MFEATPKTTETMTEEEDKLLDRLAQKGGELPANHDGLAEELSFRRRLSAAAGKKQREKTKAFLQTLEKEKTGAVVIPMKPKKKMRFYAAAAIGLIVVAASLWWGLGVAEQQEELLASLAPYPNVVTTPYVRGETNEQSALTASMHAYERKEYELANQGLGQLPVTDTTRFYQAMIRLQLEGNTPAVNKALKELSVSTTQNFYWPSLYYLAVLELANEKNAPAYEKLERLKKQDVFPQLARRAEVLLLKR